MAVRSKIPSILQKMNGALQNQSNGLAAPSFSAFTQAIKNEGMIVRGNTMNVMRFFPTQDSFLARRGITVGAGLPSHPIDAVHRRMMTTSAQAIKHKSSLGAKPFLNGVAGPVNAGFRDILADYVHHPMTRTLMLVYFRVFLLVATKDVFLSVFP